MILVGEPHPDLPVERLIHTLGLTEHVRVLGFVPIEQFVDYIGACDIILNLRYPTVGETSGSLQRALGLGKAVVVSDVVSFSELRDDICLKVPVGREEEDTIFEYLNTLVSRPDLARAMGARAQEWIARECSWSSVAERYVDFLQACVSGDWSRKSEQDSEGEPEKAAAPLAAAALAIDTSEPPASLELASLSHETSEDPVPEIEYESV